MSCQLSWSFKKTDCSSAPWHWCQREFLVAVCVLTSESHCPCSFFELKQACAQAHKRDAAPFVKLTEPAHCNIFHWSATWNCRGGSNVWVHVWTCNFRLWCICRAVWVCAAVLHRTLALLLRLFCCDGTSSGRHRPSTLLCCWVSSRCATPSSGACTAFAPSPGRSFFSFLLLLLARCHFVTSLCDSTSTLSYCQPVVALFPFLRAIFGP